MTHTLRLDVTESLEERSYRTIQERGFHNCPSNASILRLRGVKNTATPLRMLRYGCVSRTVV